MPGCATLRARLNDAAGAAPGAPPVGPCSAARRGGGARARPGAGPRLRHGARSAPNGSRCAGRRRPSELDPALADLRWSEGALTGPLFDLASKAPAGVGTAASFWFTDRAPYAGVRAEQKTPLVATQATDDEGYGTDDFVGGCST